LAQNCVEPKEPLCLSPQFSDIPTCRSDIEDYTRLIRFYNDRKENEARLERQRAEWEKEAAERELRNAKEEAERAKREAEYARAQAERAAYESKVQACKACGGTYCY
jgi:hypothetical protein